MKGDQGWKDVVSKTTELLVGFKNTDIDRLNQSDHGVLSLMPAVEELRRLKTFFASIETSALETMPYMQLHKVQFALSKLRDLIAELNDFNVHGERPSNTRDALLKKFFDEAETIYTDLYPLVAYLRQGNTEISSLLERTRTTADQVEFAASEMQSRTNEIVNEARHALKSAREATLKAGVTTQASFYATEAEKYTTRAKVSKWSLVAFGLVVAVFAYCFYNEAKDITEEMVLSKAIQVIVAKATLLGLCSYALVLLARSYFSAMHNEVVNRHRQNALSTFEALVAAGGDAANRDIVLIRAADAIFAAQPSAYSRHDASDTSVLPLLSLAQQAAKVGSSH